MISASSLCPLQCFQEVQSSVFPNGWFRDNYHCRPAVSLWELIQKRKDTLTLKCTSWSYFKILSLHYFGITLASVDDKEELNDMAESRLGLTILDDKGYTGERLTRDMWEKEICLTSLKPSNYKNNWLKTVRRLIFWFRRRMEVVFSRLSKQMNTERVPAKRFHELCTRIASYTRKLYKI